MSAFSEIFKNELRRLLHEKVFIVAVAAFTILLGYAAWSGWSLMQERATTASNLAEAQRRTLLERQQKLLSITTTTVNSETPPPSPGDPYAVGMSLQYAVMPLAPLSAFSIGILDVMPMYRGVTISTLQRTRADKDGFENPLSFLPGRIDLAFVLIYILPLFIVAIGFNFLSGENESGTLRLLLSQPVSIVQVVSAKLSVLMLVSQIPVFIVSISSFLLIEEISTTAVTKLLIWLVLAVVYGGFWLSIIALINTFGFASAANAVAAAATWLIIVLIVPSLMNIIISAVYPLPSRLEQISAMRSVNLDMRRDGSRVIAEHYQDHPELIPRDGKQDLNDFGLAFVIVQQKQKAKIDALERNFAEQLARQQSAIQSIRFISPAIIAQEAANDIAGSGLARYRYFRERVDAFDKDWTTYFVPRIFQKTNLTAAEFNTLPLFSFAEEAPKELLWRLLPGVLALFAFDLMIMFAAFRRLRGPILR